MAGRPTKLTPAVAQRVIAVLKAGNYLETAAAMAGVKKDTLREWLRRGAREAKGLYHDFAREAEEAIAQAEVSGVMAIKRAGDGTPGKEIKCQSCGTVVSVEPQLGQWTARAWILERRFPDRWGRQKPDVEINLIASPQWHEVRDKIVAALEPYPEAAEAVAQALGTKPVAAAIDVKTLPEPAR